VGMTATRKLEAENECSFCWPCSEALNISSSGDSGTCRRLCNLPCPWGYSQQASDNDAHRCVKDVDGSASCEAEVSFATLTEKKEFATRCSTSWPCEEECDNEGFVCPVGWNHIGEGECKAPPGYRSLGCPKSVRFHGWNATMKATFAAQCAVRFPCASQSAAEQEECHSIDVSRCPRSWRYQHGYCEPPLTTSHGHCGESIRLDGMTLGEKLSWGNECGVTWPCAGESHIRVGEAGESMAGNGPVRK
jgi:CPW-WPC domain-containing protein